MNYLSPLITRLILAVAILYSASSVALLSEYDGSPLVPSKELSMTTRNIVDALSSRHYVTHKIDDDLSSQIYDSYLDDLDPSRSYLLARDVAQFEDYRYKMDDALRHGDVNIAFDIFNVYHKRVIARFKKVIGLLENDFGQFKYDVDESLELDREDLPWATSESDLDDLWRKRIKNAILNLKLAGKEPADIQKLLLKRYQNRLTRTEQTNSEDVYQLYINSFTKTYDPHTQYFSPRTSENFNISMSLSLEGIGAVLQSEDEYTKVVSLVPAGPAAKSEQIEPDDKIIAVGQEAVGDMVDVIGWRLDEVVQLIRGKKGTVVRLEIIPSGGTGASESKIIKITRNKVKLEEQSAQSRIIEIEQFGHNNKIGVIDIPTFYIDFKALQQNDPNFKSTTRDVKKLLRDLVQQGVDGVVIDLRDNGGGSLQEAKTLTGLFIDRGPTVQIRSKSNRVDILQDRDMRTIYDGPLAVMVNRLSASASEIFAGAIQDYKRGLIIGSQTFGKGTVQSLIPLNHGQLKMTQAKFYRISGESTQHKGVIPDIIYPSNYDPDSIGESTLDSPLPWDKIRATEYHSGSPIAQYLQELKALHKERVQHDPEFNYIIDAFAYRRTQSKETQVSLNESVRKEEKTENDNFWVALENNKRIAEGLDPISSLDELNDKKDKVAATNSDQPVQENNLNDPKKPTTMVDTSLSKTETEQVTKEEEEDKPDAFIVESGHILLDYISLQRSTASKLPLQNPG